jgi:hypothetical protein
MSILKYIIGDVHLEFWNKWTRKFLIDVFYYRQCFFVTLAYSLTNNASEVK